MGRPKKRQRQDDEQPEQSRSSGQPLLESTVSAADVERTNFENICNGALSGSLRTSARKPSSQVTHSLDNTPPSDHPHTPSDSDLYNVSYPTDYSLWPDFSETVLPVPLQDSSTGFTPKPSDPLIYADPDTDPSTLANLPAIPDCPCLPNLYLTLSTLSTLSAFPVTSHTITTLSSAHRTAHSVIYCSVCPRKFQTGSQNVMLSNTLLTVLVDQWQRILKAPPSQLEKGFSSLPPSTHLSAITQLEWKTFAYDLVRAYVFGDRAATPPPTASPAPGAIPPPAAEITTLYGLADAMERRQKQWHGHEPETGEFPKKMAGGEHLTGGHAAGFTLQDIREMEADHKGHGNERFLCMQLASHAKRCIKSLDRGPPVLGDCQ
jgi:hypothetical protein